MKAELLSSSRLKEMYFTGPLTIDRASDAPPLTETERSALRTRDVFGPPVASPPFKTTSSGLPYFPKVK